MARMIPQRKSPPYLLIVMVFLFLISTGLAVKFHMDRDEASKKTKRAEMISRVLASKKDMVTQVGQFVEGVEHEKDVTDRGHSLEELCVMFQEKATKDNTPDMTVVSRLKGDVGSLTRIIVGKMASRREAAEKVREFGKEFKEDIGRDMVGLVDEIKALKDRVIELGGKDGMGGDIAVLEKDKKARDDQIEALKKETAKLEAEFADKMTQKNAKIDELDAGFELELAGISKQLDTERADHEKQRQELNTKIQEYAKKVADLNTKLGFANNKESILASEIKKLEVQIAILERRGDAETPLVQRFKPDGEIMSDPDRNGYCYINIGANDGVRLNWTFAVYPPGPITEQTPKKGEKSKSASKGAVVVTRVLPDVSECRLTRDEGGELSTIAKGDLVSNLAFDKTRTYTFVIEGVFDLHGTGRATTDGTDAVKTLVRNYGGKVVDDVSVNIDYVVLGEETPKPVEPGPDSQPQVRRAYKKEYENWDRYNQVKLRAINLRIPVLNSNRFLDYIGQVPQKRLEYND